MVEPQIVVLVVAGSSPVGHPPLPRLRRGEPQVHFRFSTADFRFPRRCRAVLDLSAARRLLNGSANEFKHRLQRTIGIFQSGFDALGTNLNRGRTAPLRQSRKIGGGVRDHRRVGRQRSSRGVAHFVAPESGLYRVHYHSDSLCFCEAGDRGR